MGRKSKSSSREGRGTADAVTRGAGRLAKRGVDAVGRGGAQLAKKSIQSGYDAGRRRNRRKGT